MKTICWSLVTVSCMAAMCSGCNRQTNPDDWKYYSAVVGEAPDERGREAPPRPVKVFTHQNWMKMLEAHPELPRELANVEREMRAMVVVHPYDYLLVKRMGAELPREVPCHRSN